MCPGDFSFPNTVKMVAINTGVPFPKPMSVDCWDSGASRICILYRAGSPGLAGVPPLLKTAQRQGHMGGPRLPSCQPVVSRHSTNGFGLPCCWPGNHNGPQLGHCAMETIQSKTLSPDRSKPEFLPQKPNKVERTSSPISRHWP